MHTLTHTRRLAGTSGSTVSAGVKESVLVREMQYENGSNKVLRFSV